MLNVFPVLYFLFRSSFIHCCFIADLLIDLTSVADPNPDPHVFGPPGSESGSISQRYGSESRSGSFYHLAKKVRKTLIPSAL
jgi:hypothetical protein